MNMSQKSIAEAIEAISRVTALFYQNRIEEGYKELEKALTALNQMVSALALETREGGGVMLDEVRLNEILTDALNALKDGDTILFADIFEYDLKELLSQSINQED
jgi:molybdopterin converting factor small subunit